MSGASLAACGDTAPSSAYTVRDSAGVAIVEHDAIDTATMPHFVLNGEPLLRIGVLDGEEAYQFNRIQDAELRADGSIAVLDQGAGTVRVFDSTGVLRWTTGRTGDGPGEFRAPLRIEAVRGDRAMPDTLVVYDGRMGRFSLLVEPEGLVRTVRAPELALSTTFVGLMPGGATVMAKRSVRRVVDQGRQAMASAFTIMQSDSDRAQFSTLADFDEAMSFAEEGGGAFSPAIFSAFIKFAVAADGFWFGDPDQRELQQYADSSLQRIVRWGGPDRSVSESDVDALAAAWEAEASTPEQRELGRRYLDTHPRAEQFPAFNELLADRSGTLWIQDAVVEHLDDGIRRWTRLSADGTAFEARLEHSSALRLLRLQGDLVLAVERDELDVERLVLFRMTARE